MRKNRLLPSLFLVSLVCAHTTSIASAVERPYTYTSTINFGGDTTSTAASADKPVYFFDGVSIYPNPAGEIFFVEIKANGPSTIEVFNSAGLLLAKEEVEPGTTRIDMRNNKNGTYFVKVTNGKAKNLKRIVLKH